MKMKKTLKIFRMMRKETDKQLMKSIKVWKIIPQALEVHQIATMNVSKTPKQCNLSDWWLYIWIYCMYLLSNFSILWVLY